MLFERVNRFSKTALEDCIHKTDIHRTAIEKCSGLTQIYIPIYCIYKKGNVTDFKAQLAYQAFWFGLDSRWITVLLVNTDRASSLIDSPVPTVIIYEIKEFQLRGNCNSNL